MKTNELNKEMQLIKNQKVYLLEQLKKYDDINEYSLVVRKSDKWFQYYCRKNDGTLDYIASKDRNFAARLAQKEYYEKLLKNIQLQEKTIYHFLDKYNECFRNDLLNSLSGGRKMLITPIEKTDDEFIFAWKEKYSGGNNTIEFGTPYETNNGELVRSKSEKIMADLFHQYEIVYAYEPEVILYNGQKAFPDFVLLNIRERKTYYWEHFGLASDALYSEKNLEKLAKYEKSKIVLGDNLIISTESNGVSLDVNLIKQKIEKHLL
jgi:hypothetical protein